jgi:hypothetical protein
MAVKEEKEKPLGKMTSKELRDVALTIPEITGVHGMNKGELVSAIKKARGIEETASKKSSTDVRAIKKKIQEYRAKHLEAIDQEDAKMASIYRKRISRLKKKTRRAA